MSIHFKSVLGAVAVAAFVQSAQAANIIDSTYGTGAGSFELGNYVANGGLPNDPFDRLAAGSTTITGWTVIGPTIDWLNNPNHLALDGTKSVDLKGDFGPDCSLSTLLPTTAGWLYQVDFDSYGGSLNIAQTGRIAAGSLNTTFLSPGTFDPSTATYHHFTFNFTALSSSTLLTFSSVNSNGFGPVIDKVSVTPVPLPNAAVMGAMVGLPLLAGGVLRKRRQRV